MLLLLKGETKRKRDTLPTAVRWWEKNVKKELTS